MGALSISGAMGLGLAPRRSGGGTPTPGATAPTLTQTSAAGGNPLRWSSGYTDIIPDSTDYIVMQWRVNGGTATDETAHLFTWDDYYALLDGTLLITWALYDAHTFAGGDFVEVREGVKRGAAAPVWSSWLSDTLSAVVETASAWVATTGNDKSTYVTVNGTGNLVFNGPGGGFNNAPCSARATQGRSGKRQFQVIVTSRTGAAVWLGLDDGTTPFNGSPLFKRPGKDNSAGISLMNYGFGWSIYVGGAQVQSGGTLGISEGDIITCTFDTVAGTVSFYQKHGGTTAQYGTAQAVTMASWIANVGGEDADVETAKFGTGQTRALDTGYVPYDN